MRLLADHCDPYNAALEERREAWRVRKVSISYGMQSAQLRDIRRADPDGQGWHSFSAQQQTLRRLDAVFGAFFYRVKAAATTGEKKTRGYPRFKRYQRFSQVMFVAGDGAKWVPSRGRRWAQAAFQAVGSVKVRQHRQVTGTVKTLQLKQEHRRGTASGCSAPWRKITVRSAAAAATSTTRPPGHSSTRATPSDWRT